MVCLATQHERFNQGFEALEFLEGDSTNGNANNGTED